MRGLFTFRARFFVISFQAFGDEPGYEFDELDACAEETMGTGKIFPTTQRGCIVGGKILPQRTDHLKSRRGAVELAGGNANVLILYLLCCVLKCPVVDVGDDIFKHDILAVPVQDMTTGEDGAENFRFSVAIASRRVIGCDENQTAKLGNRFSCVQRRATAHAVSCEEYGVGVGVIFVHKLLAANPCGEIFRVLNAVAHEVFTLATPSSAMMRNDNDTADPAKSMSKIVVSASAGDAVKQNHARTIFSESAVGVHDLTVNMGPFADEIEPVVVGHAHGRVVRFVLK